MSRGVDVGTENRCPLKTSDEVSVNHKNNSVYTQNHGLVRIFQDAAVDHKLNVNQGTNMATHRPMRMFDNATCIDSRAVSLNQTAANCTLSPVQRSTGCIEPDAVPADMSQVQEKSSEKNSEVQSGIVRLSGDLTAMELENVYSRVFHRR